MECKGIPGSLLNTNLLRKRFYNWNDVANNITRIKLSNKPPIRLLISKPSLFSYFIIHHGVVRLYIISPYCFILHHIQLSYGSTFSLWIWINLFIKCTWKPIFFRCYNRGTSCTSAFFPFCYFSIVTNERIKPLGQSTFKDT